jgi:hypothetical protein
MIGRMRDRIKESKEKGLEREREEREKKEKILGELKDPTDAYD